MKQIYIPYWYWEDWINGMWQKTEFDINEAIKFIGNHKKYGKAMRKVIDLWPYTMLNSLTNPSINKLAFLGQCAASYAINCPESVTRIAWKEITQKQRDLADNEAQKCIEKYLNILQHGNNGAIMMEYQMKLQLI